MSEKAVRLRNCRKQPVELHLPYGVIALPPGGEAVVSASLLTSPHLAWLVDSGKLSTEPVAAASESPDVDAAAADAPDAPDVAGDPESDESSASKTAGAATPKRDTTRRRGRTHKP
jgi:hypothetical protein